MIGPDSRYQTAERLFATKHMYDEHRRVILDGDTPSTPIRRTAAQETTYRLTVPPLPAPSSLTYNARDGENMQFIGWKMVRSAQLWWRIAEANPQVWYPLDLTVGQQLFIPV